MRDAYLLRVWQDSLGFAGCKMIRRIVGIAHVEDLDSIEDPAVRASCEENALACARSMITGAARVVDVNALAALVRGRD